MGGEGYVLCLVCLDGVALELVSTAKVFFCSKGLGGGFCQMKQVYVGGVAKGVSSRRRILL